MVIYLTRGLQKVWKRSQRRVGLTATRLYAQRHSFLSHSLMLRNSPADLAAELGPDWCDKVADSSGDITASQAFL
jgi:hypothetical protein